MESEKLRLPRGARVRLVDETTDEVTEGLFIGPEDRSDFVVVPLDDAQHPRKAGERFRIRCGSPDAMVEFGTRLIEVIDHPVTIWRLQAPTTVNSYELRDHKRIHCSVAASIESIDDALFMSGIIRDISKRGARFAVQPTTGEAVPLSTGDAVTLRCTFPGIPGEQRTGGTIVDIVQRGEEVALGIQFYEAQGWVPPYH